MNRIKSVQILVSFFLISLLISCSNNDLKDGELLFVDSPDRSIILEFGLKDSVPSYMIQYNGKRLIDWSGLGYLLDDCNLADGFVINKVTHSGLNEEWEPVWGQKKTIRNNFHQMTVSLRTNGSNKRFLNIYFRVFNDGVGIRYENEVVRRKAGKTGK